MTEVFGHLRVGDHEAQYGLPGVVRFRKRDTEHTGVYPEYIEAEMQAEDFEVILARIVEELR